MLKKMLKAFCQRNPKVTHINGSKSQKNEQVKEIKLLGITYDQTMSWTTHDTIINKMCSISENRCNVQYVNRNKKIVSTVLSPVLSGLLSRGLVENG